MNELYLKIIAAVAPAVVLAVTLIRKDRRPEPLKWLLAAIGLGVLAGPAVILIGNLTFPPILSWALFSLRLSMPPYPKKCSNFWHYI